MPATNESKLEETKGKFRITGIVRSVQSTTGQSAAGREWKKVTMTVETYKNNKIRIDILGSEQDQINAYSSKDRKTIKVDFDDRFDLPKGYFPIGLRCELEGEVGKLTRKNFVAYDGVEYVEENLHEGDSIQIDGRLSYNKYEDRNGNVVNQKRLDVQSVRRVADIDFEAEDFKPVNAFQQWIVVNDIEVDAETKIADVHTYVVDYKLNVENATFQIDGNVTPKMFTAFPKHMKFGDLLEVYGDIINETVVQQKEEEPEDEEDEFGSARPNGLADVVTRYVNSFRITGFERDSWEKKKYKEEDFVSAEAEEDYGSKGENPFANEEDDLPF